MNNKVYTIAEIQSMIAPLLSKYDMQSAQLFGSYARGEATVQSDIDILLTGNDGFRKLNIFGFTEELYRASGKRADVYEISEIGEGPLKNAIAKDGILL